MDCGGWSLSHMFSRNSYILLAAAVLLAVLLAWEADVDERGRMAAFFTVLGTPWLCWPSSPAVQLRRTEVTLCPA